MRTPVHRLAAPVAAAVLALTAGCGGATGSSGAADGPPKPAPTQTSSAQPSSPRGAPDEVAERIEVTIRNGEVTPSGERVDVKVGQPIELVVTSDAADELHVHSTPEHAFAFDAGVHHQVFGFTLRQPGVVEVELHELGDIVATLAARP
jgi:hypothetical protein